MAKIRTFRAVRPRPEIAKDLAAHPYDVINSEEARELAKGNPASFLHVGKSEIDLPESVDLYDPRVYEKARDNLQAFLADGLLFQDGSPRYYIYRQRMGDHVQTGLVACCHIDDYLNDVIRKHEFTRPDKEDDRTRHVEVTGAHTGPIFLTYPAQAKIDALVARVVAAPPVYDFVAVDGIGHTGWVVDDEAVCAELTTLFAALPNLYVADGHHRSAAAARVGKAMRGKNPGHTGDEEYNWFMAVIFPHDQLKIMDYNRVVKDICGMTPEEFLAKVEEKFAVRPLEGDPYRPARAKRFGMYLESRWYELTAREGTYDPAAAVESLDVSILQNNLLHPVLRIDDPRRDKRIHFVGGIRGLGELQKLVDSGKFKVAFSMFPTSIGELMKIADQGKVMPPKSTWFEPKLRDGLFSHLLV